MGGSPVAFNLSYPTLLRRPLMSDFWGYHLSLNVAGCRVSAVTNHDLIKDFARDLVKRIDMVPYGEPMTVRFGDGNKSGITLLQLIETSNIMCHFVDDDQHGTETGGGYFDCFSCKPYDINVVIKCFREYFGNTSEHITYFTRQA